MHDISFDRITYEVGSSHSGIGMLIKIPNYAQFMLLFEIIKGRKPRRNDLSVYAIEMYYSKGESCFALFRVSPRTQTLLATPSASVHF